MAIEAEHEAPPARHALDEVVRYDVRPVDACGVARRGGRGLRGYPAPVKGDPNVGGGRGDVGS